MYVRMTDLGNTCKESGSLNNNTHFHIDIYGGSNSTATYHSCTGISCTELILPKDVCLPDSNCLVNVNVSSETIEPIPYFLINIGTYQANSHTIQGKLCCIQIYDITTLILLSGTALSSDRINLTNWACGSSNEYPSHLIFNGPSSPVTPTEPHYQRSQVPHDNTSFFNLDDTDYFNTSFDVAIIEYCLVSSDTYLEVLGHNTNTTKHALIFISRIVICGNSGISNYYDHYSPIEYRSLPTVIEYYPKARAERNCQSSENSTLPGNSTKEVHQEIYCHNNMLHRFDNSNARTRFVNKYGNPEVPKHLFHCC